MITIKQNYKSSTRIDGLVDSKQFIDNIVLHGTALSTLETLGKEVKNTNQRCFTLTGTYGTGKSTFALFMSLLLSADKKVRSLASKKLLATSADSTFSKDFKVKKGWKVVKHVCGLGAPAEGLANSVLSALQGNMAPSSEDDHFYVELIKSALNSHDEGADGVLILLDEMGKALDYQSRENKDLHFFQELSDAIEKSKKPVVLIGFLHQSFAEYARSMTSHIQREWGKVQGRYRDIAYSPSIDESLILIGETVKADDGLKQKIVNKYAHLVDVVANYLGQEKNITSSLKNALPIDPVVSLLLGPISKRSFSQNERSLFGFLASSEKLSFNQFITTFYADDESADALKLYNANLFWQYLTTNLDHIISSSRDGKIWLEAKDALYRAALDGEELHEAITKTVALITMFGYQHQLFASREFLISYFEQLGYEAKNVTTALEELESWKVLIYRDSHQALTIFQGSDIDVNELVTSTVDAIKDGVDWVSEVSSTKHILASAHYHRKGTLRWADVQLVNERSVNLIASKTRSASENNAFVNFYVPTSKSALELLKTVAAEQPRVIFSETIASESLRTLAIEQIALRNIRETNKTLVHDKIAREEVESRLQANERALENELDALFDKSEWRYEGRKYSDVNLSTTVSAFADEIYSESPVIINELVNRNKPSGSANAAIKKLVLAMAENYDEELLGFPSDTFPAEKGLYFSCLANFGIHGAIENGWGYPTEIENSDVNNLFRKTHETLIADTNAPVWLSEIDDYWAAAPYGLTKGIRSIWLMAFVMKHMKNYAFYDKNEATGEIIFITQPDDEFALKLIQKPQNVAVQAIHIDQEKTAYLNKVAEALDSVTNSGHDYSKDVTPLNIAEGLVTFYSSLSSYTVATKNVTKKARKFLEITKKASDPNAYLFKALPELLETDVDSISVQDVEDILRTLKNAHDELLSNFKKTIEKALGTGLIEKSTCTAVIDFTDDHKLKSFAQRLSERKESDDRWVSNLISLLSSKSERNWDDLAIKRAQVALPELVEKYKIAAHRAKFSGFDFAEIEKEFNEQIKGVTSSLKGLEIEKKKTLLVALLDELENGAVKS
ncbi:conserved hypothetical protein [Alteromonas macleodii]|uniref:hypothetical protein n=1 Tax=Alteromonas sp. CyTr2 TaxID=2935039 RepID=UPI00248D60B9|nr:hypothetical protein [Alteromonas sp. CyTr2]